MTNLINQTPRAAVASFTDPRSTEFITEREAYIRVSHEELCRFLEDNGIGVVDPMAELRGIEGGIFGIGSIPGVKQVAEVVRREKVDCLILGLWHWTEPELPMRLARMCDLPVALYTADDPKWAGTVCISAVGSSMWEIDRPYLLNHLRVRGDKEPLVPWVRAHSAANRLMLGSLLMWGGSYSLRMEHLRDDVSSMKSYLIGDIITEDQFVLVKRADDILKNRRDRIGSFSTWAEKEGLKVEFDDKMLTEEVYNRQIALHLAAIDRLSELKGEDIIGVSIKCQHELSMEYGVTACFLPSFIPFGSGPEGKRSAVSTVCEGDTKGLYTCALLHALNPEIPPLFGDVKYFNDDVIIISNCGGSSLAWAYPDDGESGELSGVALKPQCQGAAGGTLGYVGRPGRVTVARLVRIARSYVMQLGLGQSIEMDDAIREKILWGRNWPHIAITMGPQFDASAFVKVLGSNHLSATFGDVTVEVEHLCKHLDIPVIRIDDPDELLGFAEEMA